MKFNQMQTNPGQFSQEAHVLHAVTTQDPFPDEGFTEPCSI